LHAGTTLMSPHDDAVDHGVFVVSVRAEMLEQLFPDIGFGPT
jgi:hypothetical protein